MKKPVGRKTKKKTHPTYKEMITEAIWEDKKWTKGTSRQAIVKYIVSNYNLDENVVRSRLRLTIKKMLEPEDDEDQPILIQPTIGCFKLSPEWREEYKKKIGGTQKKPHEKSQPLEKVGGKREVGVEKLIEKKTKMLRKKDKLLILFFRLVFGNPLLINIPTLLLGIFRELFPENGKKFPTPKDPSLRI